MSSTKEYSVSCSSLRGTGDVATVPLAAQHGPASILVSSYVSIVLEYIVAWAHTCPKYVQPPSTPGYQSKWSSSASWETCVPILTGRLGCQQASDVQLRGTCLASKSSLQTSTKTRYAMSPARQLRWLFHNTPESRHYMQSDTLFCITELCQHKI